jgi:hypothetical protein
MADADTSSGEFPKAHHQVKRGLSRIAEKNLTAEKRGSNLTRTPLKKKLQDHHQGRSLLQRQRKRSLLQQALQQHLRLVLGQQGRPACYQAVWAHDMGPAGALGMTRICAIPIPIR